MSVPEARTRSRFSQEAANAARRARRRVGLSLVSLLLLSQLASIYTSYLATQMPRQVAQVRSFELALSEAYGWLATAESSQRIFVFAAVPHSQEEIQEGLMNARQNMDRAWQLGQSIPALRGNLGEIKSAFVAKAAWIERVRDTDLRDGRAAAVKLVRSGRGRELMNEVRQRIGATKAVEATLAQRDEDLVRFYGRVDVLSGVFVVVVGLILAAALYVLTDRVARSEGDLREMQRERTAALEREVGKRTTQLQLANGDLEAFSSLTARAILREVDEIGKSLRGWEESTGVQEHVQELRRTLNSVLRLGRLSREAGPSEPVDLGEVLQKVIEDREPIPGLDIQIARGKVVEVNEKGMRILFQALVDSAWPSLVAAESPSIEFSAHQGTFVFRHSGTGTLPVEVWDLLPSHATDEVRQVDIAVAIAQRVVRRHGGKIWADSVPGRRTSIHFTLSPEKAGAETA